MRFRATPLNNESLNTEPTVCVKCTHCSSSQNTPSCKQGLSMIQMCRATAAFFHTQAHTTVTHVQVLKPILTSSPRYDSTLSLHQLPPQLSSLTFDNEGAAPHTRLQRYCIANFSSNSHCNSRNLHANANNESNSGEKVFRKTVIFTKTPQVSATMYAYTDHSCFCRLILSTACYVE